MKIKRLLIFGGLFFLSAFTYGWDEVTHGYMSEQVIEEIQLPELKHLLELNKNEFLSGSWLTDTYQYTPVRHEELNPHNLDIHSNAYIAYLKKSDVQQQANYDRLVALLLGSLAHTTEDFWLDHLLYDYPKSIGEEYTGDTYNGVISIKKFGYLSKSVKPYFPFKDMYALYREAGLTGGDFDTREKFEIYYKKLISKQYEQLRLLKLLSFLASDQIQNRSPWMAGNIMTATGGMKSCVKNSARYIEAVYQTICDKPISGILNTEYSAINNRLGIMLSFDQPVFSADSLDIEVRSSHNEVLEGKISAFSFGGTMSRLVCLVYQIEKDSVYCKSDDCNVVIKIKNRDDYQLATSFRTAIHINNADSSFDPISLPGSYGTGLFLFMICIGLSGLFFGLSGIYRFKQSSESRRIRYPKLELVIRRVLQLTGIILCIIGIYLLVTKGWIVITHI